MGTPDFSVPSLERLIRDGYEVVAVVTQPDRPKGRKKVLTPPPVKVAALEHGIKVLQPEKLSADDAVKEVLDLNPELIVTAAYGQIVPSKILAFPRFGCINVHASLLPKYRGGAPIHKAIIDGEKKTGITIMYMIDRLDAGDILSQRAVPIDDRDTVGSLHDRLSEIGAELLGETIPRLVNGEITPIPQDEAKATFAYNIKREDEQIDWEKPAIAIYNQVRGLNPWPVAFTRWNGQVLKIWWAEVTPDGEKWDGHEPGTIVQVSEEGVVVATGQGAITLKELQPAGKRRMPVGDFVRGVGSRLNVADKLG
ncbi:MAG: methionyl-tRNA formyltransferase [Bacillaceae bacterium]|nr:methionyl-tRNA formyltransferase [Bacillaceae bacterium]